MRTRYGVRRPGAGGPGDQLGERAFGVHRSARKVKCFTTEQPQCPRPSCLRKAFHHLLKLSRQMEDLGSQWNGTRPQTQTQTCSRENTLPIYMLGAYSGHAGSFS